MKQLVTNRRIAAELHNAGLLPPSCRLVELSIGVTGALVIRYERFVDVEEFGKVADALRAVSEGMNEPQAQAGKD